MAADLPSHAQAVIIGGGVIGCSVAYHLAKLGWREVVLLERRRLTCGTTWHAAGLIGQLRATPNLTRLAKYSADLYLGLEGETGQPTGFKQNGSIGLARSKGRLDRAQAPGRDGPRLRPRSPRADARRSPSTVPADRGRRSRRRDSHSGRRPGQPDRHRPGAGQGGAPERRPDHRELQGDRHHKRPRASHRPSRPSSARSAPRWWSTAPGCGAARSGAWRA